MFRQSDIIYTILHIHANSVIEIPKWFNLSALRCSVSRLPLSHSLACQKEGSGHMPRDMDGRTLLRLVSQKTTQILTYKRLVSLLAEERNQPYSQTTNTVQCMTGFHYSAPDHPWDNWARRTGPIDTIAREGRVPSIYVTSHYECGLLILLLLNLSISKCSLIVLVR